MAQRECDTMVTRRNLRKSNKEEIEGREREIHEVSRRDSMVGDLRRKRYVSSEGCNRLSMSKE